MPSPDSHYPDPATHFLDDLPPSYVDWLWPARIPLGQLTLLIGDPGVGKSLLAADLAARISSALPWPDRPSAEEPPTTPLAPLPPLDELTDADLRRRWPPIRGFLDDSLLPAGVVFASPEDRSAGALQSRLAAAGADLRRISTLDGVLDPATQDLSAFETPRIPRPCDPLFGAPTAANPKSKIENPKSPAAVSHGAFLRPKSLNPSIPSPLPPHPFPRP